MLILNLVKIGQLVQKLKGEHTQHVDLISLLFSLKKGKYAKKTIF